MQDCMEKCAGTRNHVESSDNAEEEEEKEDNIIKTAALQLSALSETLSNATSIEFHHISLSSSLSDKDDYHLFNWPIPSQKKQDKNS